MNVMEVQNITKDYGHGRGVFDVSFQVKKGEIMGFLGPNGAGKTTTIRQLMGFIRPDSGRVSILGKDCFGQREEIQRTLGYLPGEIAFIDSMTGMEFIGFIASMKGMKDLGRTPELRERFELSAEGKLKKMSKGMKQKIGIICAFMQDPDILILDEPTSGLDPLMQNAFVELLLEEKKNRKTILMSSHIFEEVEKTCDRTAIIRDGRLMAVEDMEILRQGRRKTVELVLDDAKTAKEFEEKLRDNKAAQQLMKSRAEENRLFVKVKGAEGMDQLVKMAGQYTVKDLNIHTQSLEDMFMHFYGGEKDD